MAVISTLSGVTILSSEQAAVAAATPFEDAAGMISATLAQLYEIKAQLAYLNANMPAGTNKTNISAVVSALA